MKQSWFSKKFKTVVALSGLGQGFSTHSIRRGAASHMASLDLRIDNSGWPSY